MLNIPILFILHPKQISCVPSYLQSQTLSRLGDTKGI